MIQGAKFQRMTYLIFSMNHLLEWGKSQLKKNKKTKPSLLAIIGSQDSGAPMDFSIYTFNQSCDI